MGVLSTPSHKQSSPILIKFMGYHKFLSIIFYFASIVWLFCLSSRQFNDAKTYFSENALLPGLVHSNYKEDFLARRYFTSLKVEAERYPNGMPHSFISAQFKQLGLDTYTHNYSLQYPLGENKVYTGRNVYGILRASRGASTEALVITAPYRPPDSTFTQTNAGIAMMLSLAASFRKVPYWARDIIFLVTEHEQLGIEAWLEAYHCTSSGANVINYGKLDARAGAIQAAINLEIPTEKISHIDVRMEGLNGQLPNLDLVNLVHRLYQQERFVTTLKEREDHPIPSSTDGWIYSAVSLLSLMSSQATGIPTGNHGLFHRFGIEALTIAGVHRPGTYGSTFLSMGRALEGIMRSLNNLQERFHQSFFFYLLPSTNRYISIGVYMPPFALMISSMVVQGIALYISRNEDANPTSWNFLDLGPLVLFSLICGFFFKASPLYLNELNRSLELGLSTEDAVFGGLCLISVIHCSLFSFVFVRGLRVGNLPPNCVHCAVLLMLSTLMYAVAMGNYSLAFLTGVFICPIFSFANPGSNRLGNYIRRFFLILAHPISMLFFTTVIDTYRMFPEDFTDYLNFLGKSYTATQRALIYSIIDESLYGHWLFPLSTCLYLPLWSIVWANLSNYSL